jgi:hypothetical protein
MAKKTRGASPIFLDEEIDEESSNVVYIRSRQPSPYCIWLVWR